MGENFLLDNIYSAELRSNDLAPLISTINPDERVRIVSLNEHPRLIDKELLRVLVRILAEQRRREDVIGAAPLLPLMRVYLSLLERVVIESRGVMRDKVVGLASQYAQFTAWLYTSLGDELAAYHWYDRTIEWALEISDPHMLATALSMKGNMAYRMGQLNSMLQLSREAQLGRQVSPGVRALAIQQEARALALLGDRNGAEYRFDDALQVAEQAVAHQEDEPPWIYFYSIEYFMMQRGRAYGYLGLYQRAAKLLDAGLNALAPDLNNAEWAQSYHADLRAVREKL